MQLKSLELQGFKSFPNKIKLTFDSGITAVVGPNGSGKSNISDAIRWVLGEQSTKSLRGSKMEDVIFDGTKTRKSQGFAVVSLTLDNSDRRLMVDSDDVTVTRRYYRSGESEYKINGNTVRLKDVHELFMDTGLGRDGYSMVGQGQIDSIISSRSEDRREIFEEAAGISRYRYRKADAEKKLSQAEENLVRLRDILAELESRVEPLRAQSAKAEKFLTLSGQRKKLEIGIWLGTMNRAKLMLHECEDKIALATANYEDAGRSLQETEQQAAELTEKVQDITARIENIRAMASKMEEDAVKKDGEAAVIENTLKHNSDTVGRMSADMRLSAGTGKELDAQISEKQNRIASLERLIEEKRRELSEHEAGLEKLRQSGDSASSRIAGHTLRLSRISTELAEQRIRISTSSSSIDEINARRSVVEETAESKRSQISSLESQLDEYRQNVEFCENRIRELKNIIDGQSIVLERRREKGEKLRASFDNIKAGAGEKRQRAKMLSDLEKNMEGYQTSVKAVMRESKRGTLKGIHGTVSQLISVDSEYSAAIETALGAALQNIVTDDENVAKRCINYLKSSREGRATFLPLTSVKQYEFRERAVRDEDGIRGIASELVTCDGKYTGIVGSLLGRTAVAEDLDTAVRVARKYSYRFRVVTLDGQVVNAGGSMTGGSQVRGAGMLSRAGEIERLEKEALQLDSEAGELQKRLEEERAKYSEMKAQLNMKRSELTEANEDLIRQQGEQRLVAEQLENAKASLDELLREDATSAERLEKLKLEMSGGEAEISRLNQEQSLLRDELDSLTGERDGIEAEFEKTNSALSELRLEIMAADKDREAQAEAAAMLKESKAGHSERIKKIEAEIDGIREENRRLELRRDTLAAQSKRLRDESAANRELISGLQRERTSAEEKSAAVRRDEKEKVALQERLRAELSRLEDRKSSLKDEYEDTAKKLYDEYELTVGEASRQCGEVDDMKAAQRQLSDIRGRIRDLGSVNVAAIDEYKEVSMRYEFMSRQIEDVENSKREITRLIEELTSAMSEKFMDCFNRINASFNTTFGELFGGGQAKLILLEPEDVLTSPIDIHIQPPGKNVKTISLFSGGEKALSAIALLFAILKENPAPFCVFDEIEAALDDVNVDRYAQYLRKMSVNTQFIAITHRRGTMEEADVLYGVTMQEKGISTLLELRTAQMAEELKLDS